MTMQVLTLWQPWATAYVIGPKDVENRSPHWSWLRERCPFVLAVHAASRPVFGKRGHLLESAADSFDVVTERWPLHGAGGIIESVMKARWPRPRMRHELFPLGAILGVVEVIGVVPAETTRSAWAVPGHLCLVARRRWVLPNPLPHRGQQGISTPHPDIEARIWSQAMEVR